MVLVSWIVEVEVLCRRKVVVIVWRGRGAGFDTTAGVGVYVGMVLMFG